MMTNPNRNPHLANMHSDTLFHLGIHILDTIRPTEIQSTFGNTRVVCMGGTKERMQKLVKYLNSLLVPEFTKEQPRVVSGNNARFTLYKMGPILCVDHGIGMPSISILLHELFKLVYYAHCKDPIFLRLGTCGGLNVTPGTVIITEESFNGKLEPAYNLDILGNSVSRPTRYDEKLINQLMECRVDKDVFDLVLGNTLSTDCFYEGQGRLDGICCNYTEKDKLAFFQKCLDKGIRNIEMETSAHAALSRHLGIRSAGICVALLDRMQKDQITLNLEQKDQFENHVSIVAGRLIMRLLREPH